jgi:hypothetical protein
MITKSAGAVQRLDTSGRTTSITLREAILSAFFSAAATAM